MADRPFDAPNLLRHAAGRLHGFPDISEDLLDAADEIDRLEAENQRLTDENARAWNACNEECQRKEELQALIDAWAAARVVSSADDVPDEARWDAYADSLAAARDALLAAATKEDDRG